MKWGDLKVGDVMHTDNTEYNPTSWLLLERGELTSNGMIAFKWMSLDDAALVETRNLASGGLHGYRVESRV